ncbi:protein FAR1-RELATED SEQUENCE 5-like [Amaranthus tricolor]|uniref:protein FAR1-RELATED SEQUENCE 5-like n=1 Tax=Amaranthus tricolor TaxID=29722 RepID=UPI00258351E3|nr:protein FAR1-RELATED SEQUENCE 5-like [Amaranthus tricolor]
MQLVMLGQKDNGFFWNMKFDDDAKLVALFQWDFLMKEDFRIYEDVFIFDTTYTIRTLQCLDEKNPVLVFTDQDATIARAVEEVYPFSRHRLCLWHILKNAVSHYGALKSDANFKDAFNKCLMGCSNPTEFQECWENMVDEFKLKRNQAYYKCESKNNAIGFEATKITSLQHFFKIFQKTIERWREREITIEFYYTTTPTSAFRLMGLLRHASEVYIATLFRDFEQSSSWLSHLQLNRLSTWEIKRCIAYMKFNTPNTMILYMLTVLVLHLHSVQKIPAIYILPRWTKNAKKDIWDTLYDNQCPSTSLEPPRISTLTWRQSMRHKFYNLVLKSQSNEEAKKVVEALYNKASDEVGKIIERARNEIEAAIETAEVTTTLQVTTQVKVLERTVTKGGKKRLKGHFETSQKKGS